MTDRSQRRVDGEPPEPDDTIHARDVLDVSVRCLALGTAGIRSRVKTASHTLLGGLSGADLAEAEERVLLEQIDLAALELVLLDGESNTPIAAGGEDPAAEAIAARILDLRDMVIGRAIRQASSRARPRKPERDGGEPT